MQTETSFEKIKDETLITVKVGEPNCLQYHFDLSIYDAQELLLQLGDILMETQGHVQTARFK